MYRRLVYVITLSVCAIVLIYSLTVIKVDPFNVFKPEDNVIIPIESATLDDLKKSTLHVKIYGYLTNPLNVSVVAHASSVIIGEYDNKYLALTNYHVVDDIVSDYTITKYTGVDFYGNEHLLTPMFLEDNNILNYSITHDIALVTFNKLQNNLYVNSITTDIARYDFVLSVSYSSAILSVTEGNVSTVTSNVIWHSAYYVGGASGSGIYNQDNVLFGLAKSVGLSNGVWLYGIAVAPSVIINYLEMCNVLQYVKEV